MVHSWVVSHERVLKKSQDGVWTSIRSGDPRPRTRAESPRHESRGGSFRTLSAASCRCRSSC